MAQIVSPVLSHSNEDKILLSPPPTEFPYPETKNVDNRRSERVESDATLCEVPAPTQNDEEDKAIEGLTPIRPNIMTSKKFVTEAPKPVAMRPVVPVTQRRSTGGNRLVKPSTTPTAPESSSSDDDSHHFHRTRKSSDYSQFSKSKLNQVRRRPTRSFSKFEDVGRFTVGNEHFQTRGKVARDGRLDISVNETVNSGYLAKALGGTLHRHLRPQKTPRRSPNDKLDQADTITAQPIPRMNIVIMVIGSRGDIQPFLKIGKILKDKHNHRVRIATHPTFKKFVEEDIGLEFFSVGGDPSELMAFMVKNPGLVPTFETVKAGEVGKRRDSMFEMFQGFWRACINATDDEKDVHNAKMMGDKFPFIADAIIANPPSFAHFHCAERLGIPLHLVFTFPYTPTQAFPHPLTNIKASNVDQNHTNFMSYPLVDLMTWQGLGDLVNRFRVKTLGLPPVSTLWAPGQLSRLKVATTYLWSPSLVPKPADWGPEIDIAGYVFLDLASSFKPPDELANFLNRKDGLKVLYIGFGSISGIADPAAFAKLVFEGVEAAGVRAVVSKGWGGMGDGMDIPDSIHLVDNVPHDWLFPRVDAVVHHGGAGTTAMGLKCGKPTMIIPFFGDQPFWSAMVAKAGAGAKESLPLKKLDVEKFAEGIRQCLEPEAKEKAEEIAKSIEEEGDGAENAVNSFHRCLALEEVGEHSIRCGVFQDRLAVWQVRRTKMQLSALAADLLVENKQLKWADLDLLRHCEWHDFQGPGEPITGAGGAALASLQEAVHGISNISQTTKKDMERHERAKQRKQEKKQAAAGDGGTPGKTLDLPTTATIGRTPGHTVDPSTTATAEELSLDSEIDSEFEMPVEELGALPTISSASTDVVGLRPTISRASTDAVGSRPAAVTVLKDVGQGVGHSANAIAAMPLDIWTALALGFRNAPRLYGDATVRPPPHNITGVRSGLAAAGNELWLGLYDGVSGLVRIPYHDVKADGVSGLPKGVARGVGGLVLKPISGLLGLGAYSGEGLRAGLRKCFRDTTKTDRWIRRARMIQGAKDVMEYSGRDESKVSHPGRTPELEDARSHAITRWSSHEKAAAAEQREKQKKLSIVPSRGRKTKSWRTKGEAQAQGR